MRPDIESIRQTAVERLSGPDEGCVMDHRVPELCEYTLKLEALLQKYGEHTSKCGKRRGPRFDACTCGFDAAEAEALRPA